MENYIRYKGKGNHSVKELELIIAQREEELHLIRSGQDENASMARDDVDNKRLPTFNSRDDFDNQFYDVVRKTINMIHRDISISGNLPLNINDTFMKGEEIGVLFKNNYIFNLVKEKLKETGFELKKEYWTQQRYSGTNYIISDIKL